MAQFLLGLAILRWSVGRRLLQCIGDKFTQFVRFTDHGSFFAFEYLATGEPGGSLHLPPLFAFKVEAESSPVSPRPPDPLDLIQIRDGFP